MINLYDPGYLVTYGLHARPDYVPANAHQVSSLVEATGVRPQPVRVERRHFHDNTTERRGGEYGQEITFGHRGDPPDPVLVVRRVGKLAQVQGFDGQPYSGLMSVEEATAALREALG